MNKIMESKLNELNRRIKTAQANLKTAKRSKSNNKYSLEFSDNLEQIMKNEVVISNCKYAKKVVKELALLLEKSGSGFNFEEEEEEEDEADEEEDL